MIRPEVVRSMVEIRFSSVDFRSRRPHNPYKTSLRYRKTDIVHGQGLQAVGGVFFFYMVLIPVYFSKRFPHFICVRMRVPFTVILIF